MAVRRRDGRDADTRRRKRRCDAASERERRRRRIIARRELVRDDLSVTVLSPSVRRIGAQLF